MKMNRKPGGEFWQHVRKYLTVHLTKIRGLSPRTVDVYRQSIAAYCSFLKEKSGTAFSKVSFEHLTRDSIMKFIRWLREEK
jgi:integrase/recombinase XerD